MWALVAEVGIWAGLYVLNRLLRPKAQVPKPTTRDNLTLPRTEFGTAMPIVYGRTRVTAPVLAWTGDLTHQTFTINGSYVINYGFDMFFVVGLPMKGASLENSALNKATPMLYGAWYGDKKLPLNQPLPNSGYSGTGIVKGQTICQPGFLGGPGQGGGLIGTMWWYWGSPNQDLTSDTTGQPTFIGDLMIANVQGHTDMVPGYRNQMCVAFCKYTDTNNIGVPGYLYPLLQFDSGVDDSATHPQNFTIGEAASVEGFSFEVGTYGSFDPTITTMVTPGFDFGGDADPVEVIYDLLTNPLGKIGLDPTKINKPSFLAASTVLKAESHGYSNTIYDTTDGVQAVSAVLQQIDAALYEEPTTGQLTMKLIRNDYTIGALQVFDSTNIVEIEDYGIGGWPDLVTEVRISFSNRDLEYKSDVAVAQSLANATANGNRRNVKTIDYPGVTNAVLAGQIAGRELNALSRPLKKISLTVNRDGYELRPGTCFVVNYPEYNLVQRVFRAQRVDQGQLFDNKVTLDAVDDVFASTYAALFSVSLTFTPFVPQPYPLVHQAVVECPRWVALRMHEVGIMGGGEDLCRLLPLAAPATNDTRFLLTSKEVAPSTTTSIRGGSTSGGNSTGVVGILFSDVPVQDFPISFILSADYAREAEPYDTTVGIQVTQVSSPFLSTADIVASLTTTNVESSIPAYGVNMLAIVEADGSMEFMCFGIATYSSGTDFTLTKVWRGLMDTPPIAHKAGARGYFFTIGFGGRRSYAKHRNVDYRILPSAQLVNGSGGDTSGDIFTVGRPQLPLPPSDLRVSGERITGTLGQPAIPNQYKVASTVEEDVDVWGRFRNRRAPFLVRGDTIDATNTDSTAPSYTFDAKQERLGVFGMVAQINAGGGGGNIALGLLFDGFGLMTLKVGATRTVATADSVEGIGGTEAGDILTSYTTANISLYCPEWRNLFGNVRFTDSLSNGWTVTNLAEQTGTFGVSKMASAKYVQPSAASATLVQAPVYLKGFGTSKMTALAFGYYRGQNADVNDTVAIRLDQMFSGSSAANASTTFTIPAANWAYREQALALIDFPTTANPYDAIKVTNTFAEVAGGGTANADVCASELGLVLGQISGGTHNNLTNPSFDSGTTASWTNLTNSFVVASTIASPSSNYAQGGAFATSAIEQEFALPAGYEVNTWAVVRAWRAQTLANDTGEIKIDAMDGASTVLATATTTAETLATLNEWYERVIPLKITVSGATKVRVTLTATRSLGAGNSGACFDEIRLGLLKCLENTFQPSGVPVVADWSTYLQEQVLPSTWQEFAVAFPSIRQPSYVFSGEDNTGIGNELSRRAQHVEWSDNLTHQSAPIKGHFADNYEAFVFARASGALSLCLEARGSSIGQIGAYKSDAKFTAVCGFVVDELAWTTAAGLCGRRDLTAGWSLGINASGFVIAEIVDDTGGHRTITSGVKVTDGAFHMAAMIYNGVSHQFILVVDNTDTTITGSVFITNFDRQASTCAFRIGKSSDFSDTFPGRIARVYLFDVALSPGDVSNTMYTLNVPGGEPVGELASSWGYTRDQVVWACPGIDSVDIAPLCAYPVEAMFAWATENKFGGIGMCPQHKNYIPSFDFSDATKWTVDSGASAVFGAVDGTGAALGLDIIVNSTDGVLLSNITGGASATWVMVFYAYSLLGVTVALDLMNASNIVKNSQTATIFAASTLSVGAHRYVVQFTGWDNSTPTMKIRLRAASGAGELTLGHVMYLAPGSDVPVIFPGPNVTVSATTAERDDNYGRGFNNEGEIVAHLVSPNATPAAAYTLANMTNGVDNKNRREIVVNASGTVTLNHYDGVTPTNASASTAAVTDWNARDHFIRARWNRAGLLDPGTTPFASIIAGEFGFSGAFRAQARTATWTDSLTQNTKLVVNAGSQGGGHYVLRSIALSSREEVSFAASQLS